VSALVKSCDELRDLLLVTGIVPPTEVVKAEQLARESGSDLEAVLRKNRLLTEAQIGAVRAMSCGVPFCHAPEYVPRGANAELVPETTARTHVMFPMFVCDGVMTLLIEDPNNLAGIDQVRRQTKMEVDVCLGNRDDILSLVERAYGASQYLEEFSINDSLNEIGSSEVGGESQPIIRLVDNLILEAVRQRASDIHIEPGERELRIRIRIDGVLTEVAAPPPALHRAIVSRIKVVSKLDISKTRAPQDGAFPYRHGNTEVLLRVSVLPSVFGEAVVLRILRNESEAISLTDLGMEKSMRDRFHQVVSSAHGMVLVSGPTGSGKSTTLYAAMRVVASPQKNIITIEDPVEYRTSQIRQVQVNTEANLTFATGLRSILRQDPDVIMVGEIRDRETAQISVQAALTGHLLLSTVHTNDAIGAVARLRDLGVPEFLISSSLLAVLAQRLCRRICPECPVADSPPEYLFHAIGLDPAKLDFEPKRGKGCRRCVGTGFAGRVGVFELLEISEDYSKMIVAGKSTEEIRSAARAKEMKFLVDDGILKIRAGLTTVDEVARVAGRC
jgi:type IV pilus assembly protein PilB